MPGEDTPGGRHRLAEAIHELPGLNATARPGPSPTTVTFVIEGPAAAALDSLNRFAYAANGRPRAGEAYRLECGARVCPWGRAHPCPVNV